MSLIFSNVRALFSEATESLDLLPESSCRLGSWCAFDVSKTVGFCSEADIDLNESEIVGSDLRSADDWLSENWKTFC